MRDHHTDLRVVRTREAIRNALMDLVEEKGFEAVTVKDITTKANINRGTFYAHYQDKFDLINKWIEEVTQQIHNIINQEMPKFIANLESNSKPITLIPVFPLVIEYIYENNRFMKAVLSSKGDLTFQTKLKDLMWKILFENIPNELIKEEKLLVPKQYLFAYISSAHIGLIQQWLNSGMIETPQEMAQILSTITINGPLFTIGLKK